MCLQTLVELPDIEFSENVVMSNVVQYKKML